MEAGNLGAKKEADELGMEASDHPFGEEVPLFDLTAKPPKPLFDLPVSTALFLKHN